MQHIPPPFERFEMLKGKIGLRPEDVVALDPYRELLASHKVEFGNYFYETLHDFPDTRRFLELERRRGQLRINWTTFFGLLFTSRFNRQFIEFLWKSGLTHVEMSVDQRYINLGYILARRFCSDLIKQVIPEPDRYPVFETVAKKIDLCLLIATDAFFAATTQCDSEVMKGIAHQVRNPITIIGGFIGTLKRKAGPGSPLGEIYQAMFDEAKRLEHMVTDVGKFIDIFRKTAELVHVDLEPVIRQAWQDAKPSAGGSPPGPASPAGPPALPGAPGTPGLPSLEIRLDPAHCEVLGDREQFRTMFRHLLENSLEAQDPAEPAVTVTSSVREGSPAFLTVEIFNSGPPPSPEILDKLFTPFYSSKPLGTGFGLPIARLVVRKVQGNVTLEPVPGRGTRTLVKLPLA
jgi:signal transduction histidine kinase